MSNTRRGKKAAEAAEAAKQSSSSSTSTSTSTGQQATTTTSTNAQHVSNDSFIATTNKLNSEKGSSQHSDVGNSAAGQAYPGALQYKLQPEQQQQQSNSQYLPPQINGGGTQQGQYSQPSSAAYPPHPTTGYGYEERTGLQALMGLSTAAAYAASNQPQSLPRPQPRRVAPKGGVHRQFKASHKMLHPPQAPALHSQYLHPPPSDQYYSNPPQQLTHHHGMPLNNNHPGLPPQVPSVGNVTSIVKTTTLRGRSFLAKSTEKKVDIDFESKFFGCYWRNRNSNLVGFPCVPGQTYDYGWTLLNKPTGFNPRTCVGEPVTMIMALPQSISSTSICVTSHMAFVDELKESDDHLLGTKYTKTPVVDGQIVVSTKLTAVRDPQSGNPIVASKKRKGGPASGAISTTEDPLVLYRVVLSPKRWRYTGLGSKMNDKQAMTHSPVTSMKHAAEAPKRCLVTLRITVYHVTEKTEDETMNPIANKIQTKIDTDAPRYHESEAKVKVKKDLLKKKKKEQKERTRLAAEALHSAASQPSGDVASATKTAKETTVLESSSSTSSSSTSSSSTSSSSSSSSSSSNIDDPDKTFLNTSNREEITGSGEEDDGRVYTILAVIRSPSFVVGSTRQLRRVHLKKNEDEKKQLASRVAAAQAVQTAEAVHAAHTRNQDGSQAAQAAQQQMARLTSGQDYYSGSGMGALNRLQQVASTNGASGTSSSTNATHLAAIQRSQYENHLAATNATGNAMDSNSGINKNRKRGGDYAENMTADGSDRLAKLRKIAIPGQNGSSSSSSSSTSGDQGQLIEQPNAAYPAPPPQSQSGPENAEFSRQYQQHLQHLLRQQQQQIELMQRVQQVTQQQHQAQMEMANQNGRQEQQVQQQQTNNVPGNKRRVDL